MQKLFISDKVHIFFAPSFYWEIQFLHYFFRQRYARAFIFSCQIFVVFCVLNSSQSFRAFVNIMKDAPCLNAKKLSIYT